MCGPRDGPAAGVIFRSAMVHSSRKPADVIAEELWDHDDPDSAAEDIIEALEHSGWRLVFVPDLEVGTAG